MRVRHHYHGNERIMVGELWTDETGVVQTSPPELRGHWESTVVDSWPEHPDEFIRIGDGDLWLRGLLGLDPADEPPMVTTKTSEYLKLKRESDEGLALLAQMRDRPDPWSAEEERRYRQWARDLGWSDGAVS